MQEQLRSYEGYFENGSFFTAGQTIRLPEKMRVIVTISGEPIKTMIQPDETERRKAWLKELDEAKKEAAGEEFIYIPRSKEMRPPINFSDQGLIKMTYALDTNIIIHYLRDEPRICQKIYSAVSQGDTLIIPNVVNYEIKRGFEVSSAPRKEKEYKILTKQGGFCDIIEMDANSWERAEKVYAELYRKRLTVGEMDILIGAFCLENNFTLVTNNTKDFKDMGGLKLVDWLEQAE